MRIIRGKYKGKQIKAPVNLPVRPTTDYAKEGLFNVLENYIDFEGLKFLDLYSGTGNISYEMASRGSSFIISIDQDSNCVNFIKKTFTVLNYTNSRVIKSDALRFIASCNQKFDLIFADPPYALENIPSIPIEIFKNKLLNDNGWLIVEHDENTDLSTIENFENKRNYGKVNFSFFHLKEASK